MSRIIDQNGIPLFNFAIECKGLDSVNDRSPCGFTIAEVPDLRTWYAQVLLQVISHSVSIGDCSHQVWDMARFIFVDPNNQREDMRRWPIQ